MNEVCCVLAWQCRRRRTHKHNAGCACIVLLKPCVLHTRDARVFVSARKAACTARYSARFSYHMMGCASARAVAVCGGGCTEYRLYSKHIHNTFTQQRTTLSKWSTNIQYIFARDILIIQIKDTYCLFKLYLNILECYRF